MLPEDDPLNMSIHSRMNVWETKIHQTEAEKEEAARAEQEILVARQQLRHNSGMSMKTCYERVVMLVLIGRQNEIHS